MNYKSMSMFNETDKVDVSCNFTHLSSYHLFSGFRTLFSLLEYKRSQRVVIRIYFQTIIYVNYETLFSVNLSKKV